MTDLSPRLMEVAALVAQGLSNKAIARRLGVCPRTAGEYVIRLSHLVPGPGSARVRIVRWWVTSDRQRAA